MRKTKVVNLFAGPGAGKSSLAYSLTGLMKFNQIEAELVTEYAKDVVWRDTTKLLENQIYVFAKQYERTHRLLGKVDYVITDGPFLLSLFYGKDRLKSFDKLIWDTFNQFDNINVFVKRVKPFNPNGRLQNEEESKEIDKQLRNFLIENNMLDYEVEGSEKGVEDLYNYLSNRSI